MGSRCDTLMRSSLQNVKLFIRCDLQNSKRRIKDTRRGLGLKHKGPPFQLLK